MDNRYTEKSFGDWLDSLAKSKVHDNMRYKYEKDYVLVMNLCDGFGYIPEISKSTIEGATERYKHFNKSLLDISGLSDERIREVSAQIDSNSENLKHRWINILRNKGIKITD